MRTIEFKHEAARAERSPYPSLSGDAPAIAAGQECRDASRAFRVEARDELHRSLDRLGVDRVDLWQLHNLADPIEWDITLSPVESSRRRSTPAPRAWCDS